MILQNLSRAIREQNYYAVAIEFVIVIAGVVIGFQVTGWAEDRNAQAREAVLLARFGTDFRTIEADALEALNYTNRLLEPKHALIAAFDSDCAIRRHQDDPGRRPGFPYAIAGRRVADL